MSSFLSLHIDTFLHFGSLTVQLVRLFASLAMFNSLDFHFKEVVKYLLHSLPGIVLAACQSSSLSRERAVQSCDCLSPCR